VCFFFGGGALRLRQRSARVQR